MRDSVRTSIEVLARGQDPGGAFAAASGFPVYRYCWIRDGSFCAQALDAVGEHGRAAAFHIFQFLWVWNDLLVALVFGRRDAGGGPGGDVAGTPVACAP